MPAKESDITMSQNNWEDNSGTIQARVGNYVVNATASEADGIDAEGTVSGVAAGIFKTAANAGTLIGYDFYKEAPTAG